MQRTGWIVAVVAMLVFVGENAAWAEGWWPVWNPFASSTPARPAARPEPTIFQRMTSGTQQAFAGAGRMLNPWQTETAQRPSARLTGTQRNIARTPVPADSETPWWWPWDAEEDTQKFSTPGDWLSQPRP